MHAADPIPAVLRIVGHALTDQTFFLNDHRRFALCDGAAVGFKLGQDGGKHFAAADGGKVFIFRGRIDQAGGGDALQYRQGFIAAPGEGIGPGKVIEISRMIGTQPEHFLQVLAVGIILPLGIRLLRCLEIIAQVFYRS